MFNFDKASLYTNLFTLLGFVILFILFKYFYCKIFLGLLLKFIIP